MKTKGLAILAAIVFVGFCGIVLCQANDRGTCTITLSGNPAPGDTVTVDGTKFTFVEEPSSGYDVAIGATVTESNRNLAEAIQKNTDCEVS